MRAGLVAAGLWLAVFGLAYTAFSIILGPPEPWLCLQVDTLPLKNGMPQTICIRYTGR